jgi:hypothetical protein
MSTGAFLKIFDFQTPADKEGKLLYNAEITTTPTTIGRTAMGLPPNHRAVSRTAMECHVDPFGNIVVCGGVNGGTPWCVDNKDVVPNLTVHPGSQLKLVQWLMHQECKPELYGGRRLEYIFTNKDKVQTIAKSDKPPVPKFDKPPIQDKVQTATKSDKPPVAKSDKLPIEDKVQTMEMAQKTLAMDVFQVRTEQVKFESTQKNILEDIVELKQTAEGFQILDAFCRDNLFKGLNTLSDKVEQLKEDNNILENIQKIDLMIDNIKDDVKDMNTFCRVDLYSRNNALRARVEQLEEQNNKLQKSQDDILATVKTLQEQNIKLMQMMQVKTAPAPAEPDKGDTFDSIPAIKTPVTEDSGVSHSASDEVIDETEDEDDEPGAQTLQTLQNDQNEDDETQPDDDDFGPQTQVYDKNGLQTLENDQPEDPEKDSNAGMVNQTLDFYNAAPDAEQEIHENQLAYVDPMDNQTLIANQTMESEDDDEVVMKPPKKVTDDEMKEIVDTVIYKHLDTIGSKYDLETTRSLLSVVKEKLNQDNIHFHVKGDDLIQKIRDAFNAWANNYINKKRPMDDSDPKSEQSGAKKPKFDTDQQMQDAERPMDDSDPKSEQSGAKKPKFDTDQQMQDADSGSKESDATMIEPFKPVKLDFKRPDKQVVQSPISIMRSDPKKKDLLNSWAYDASLQLYQDTKKNHQIKAVYTHIMDKFWENAKKDHPEWNLASYEVKANDWNLEHESFRNEKKAQKKKK